MPLTGDNRSTPRNAFPGATFLDFGSLLALLRLVSNALSTDGMLAANCLWAISELRIER